MAKLRRAFVSLFFYLAVIVSLVCLTEGVDAKKKKKGGPMGGGMQGSRK